MSFNEEAAKARQEQLATASINGDGWTQMIDGYARAAQERGWKNSYFKAPLISHVEGNLWQGGCSHGIVLPDTIKYVVSLYKWEQYALKHHQERYEVTMYDAGEIPDVEQLDFLANQVNIYRDRSDGDVLVHCQAGLNRSGLVAALSLVKRGMAAGDAINLLRESRSPMVLCNEHFESWLIAGDYGV